jgi:hypothetical protein
MGLSSTSTGTPLQDTLCRYPTRTPLIRSTGLHQPAHFDMFAICASIGLTGGGMSAIFIRSAFTTVS